MLAVAWWRVLPGPTRELDPQPLLRLTCGAADLALGVSTTAGVGP
jgi:hypothetical protein